MIGFLGFWHDWSWTGALGLSCTHREGNRLAYAAKVVVRLSLRLFVLAGRVRYAWRPAATRAVARSTLLPPACQPK